MNDGPGNRNDALALTILGIPPKDQQEALQPLEDIALKESKQQTQAASVIGRDLAAHFGPNKLCKLAKVQPQAQKVCEKTVAKYIDPVFDKIDETLDKTFEYQTEKLEECF